MKLFLSIFLSVCITPILLFGQGPPIFTDTPVMLGLNGAGIRTFGNFNVREESRSYSHILAIPYNLTPGSQIGAIIPWATKSSDQMPSVSGLGDLKIFVKHQIFKKDGKGKTLRSLVKFTETLPTGNSTDQPFLGTGHFQSTLSLVTGYITTKYGLYSEFGYNLSDHSSQNRLVYGAGVGFPLLPQNYPSNQLNLFLETGGSYLTNFRKWDTFLLSFGAQYIFGRRMLTESGIQFPLNVDSAADDNLQFNLMFGIRVLLF